MFREMITQHATPSQDAIAEVVDNQIEYRMNGAAIVDPDSGRGKFRIQTN
jgi:hypothetical protein